MRYIIYETEQRMLKVFEVDADFVCKSSSSRHGMMSSSLILKMKNNAYEFLKDFYAIDGKYVKMDFSIIDNIDESKNMNSFFGCHVSSYSSLNNEITEIVISHDYFEGAKDASPEYLAYVKAKNRDNKLLSIGI